MHRFTDQFVEYCHRSFVFYDNTVYRYASLPVCIIDCVYSLRAPYYSVTLPIVDRYANRYMGGDRYAPGDTLTAFLRQIDVSGGPRAFADSVLKNRQKLGGKRSIPKENVCYQLARYLRYLHIDTLEDFRNYECPELLDIVIRSVNGLGNAGTNYLFMLAGDENRCKPDVHIHRCICDSCGEDVSDEECQTILTEAVSILRGTYPSLTVRQLDSIIWQEYQSRNRNKKVKEDTP